MPPDPGGAESLAARRKRPFEKECLPGGHLG